MTTANARLASVVQPMARNSQRKSGMRTSDCDVGSDESVAVGSIGCMAGAISCHAETYSASGGVSPPLTRSERCGGETPPLRALRDRSPIVAVGEAIVAGPKEVRHLQAGAKRIGFEDA